MTTTPPLKGSVNGEHGLPKIVPVNIRVFVDGDMPRGVVAYDVLEGWADVLCWDDDGNPLHNGEDFVSQRVYGKVEVKGA